MNFSWKERDPVSTEIHIPLSARNEHLWSKSRMISYFQKSVQPYIFSAPLHDSKVAHVIARKLMFPISPLCLSVAPFSLVVTQTTRAFSRILMTVPPQKSTKLVHLYPGYFCIFSPFGVRRRRKCQEAGTLCAHTLPMIHDLCRIYNS